MGKYDQRANTKREEREMEKSYRGIYSAPKKRRSKKEETASHRKVIIAVCISVIVLAISALITCLLVLNKDYTILDNVTVAGVDVGGLKKAEAIKLVERAVKNTYSKTKMAVTVLDSVVEIPEDAVAPLNVNAAVNEACRFGNQGSKSKREAERALAAEGYAIDLTPYLDLDEELIKAKLSELGMIYNSTLTQSTYEISGDKPSFDQIQAGTNLQTLIVTLGVPEYGLNMDALYKQVLQSYSNNIFSVTGECSMINPDPIDLEAILAEYYIAPVDAKWESGKTEPTPGLYGYGFDPEAAKVTLSESKGGSVVSIPFTQITPPITAESLLNTTFKDVLGTYTAIKDSDADRATNLRLACESINGFILYPGEIFSYSNTLGEQTLENGYRPGPGYSGNDTVLTVGGGVCQVSSALYYAAMLADLEIIERECHGFAPTYMPLGTDATISDGLYDFRFCNNTDSPIRIEASADGGTTTVTIKGTDNRDYYIGVRYEILEETPCETTYEQYPADNAQGYKDGDYIVEPYKGYEIVTYRCKYDKATDQLISEKKEAESSYRKRDGVICEIIDSQEDPNDNSGSQGLGGSGGGIGSSGSID